MEGQPFQESINLFARQKQNERSVDKELQGVSQTTIKGVVLTLLKNIYPRKQANVDSFPQSRYMKAKDKAMSKHV